MPILIHRKPSGLYDGAVTPPHGVEPWSSDQPMTQGDLVAALLALGCHQTDIGDAFYAADPNWLRRPSEPDSGQQAVPPTTVRRPPGFVSGGG